MAYYLNGYRPHTSVCYNNPKQFHKHQVSFGNASVREQVIKGEAENTMFRRFLGTFLGVMGVSGIGYHQILSNPDSSGVAALLIGLAGAAVMPLAGVFLNQQRARTEEEALAAIPAQSQD